MFFGAYDEKDKKEIPLNDVDPNVCYVDFIIAKLNTLLQEFEEMLAVLYPSGEKITGILSKNHFKKSQLQIALFPSFWALQIVSKSRLLFNISEMKMQ